MDISLHYYEEGTGEPLVLLHGNGEDLHYFDHQIPYFAEKYRVIALDTRGHGESPRGTAPFLIRQFANDLKDFLDEMGLEKVNLLGFSDGGNIALYFALKNPDRVNKLILNGANLYPSGVKFRFQHRIMLSYQFNRLKARRSPEAARKAELLGLMVKEPNVRPEQLNDLKVRTLVIAGTRDLILRKHTKLIYNSLPNAKLVFLQGGHGIAQSNYERYNEEVGRFLEDKH